MVVPLSFFRSQTAQKFRAQGRAEYRAQGESRSILIILHIRGLEPTEDEYERITNCVSSADLRSWTIRSLTATTVEELFQ